MRKRHQSGSIEKRSASEGLVWSGLYRDERGERRRVTLGTVTKLSASEARQKLDEILAPVNMERDGRKADSEMTLGEYILNKYIPWGDAGKWKASTSGSNKYMFNQLIVNSKLGKIKLRDLDRFNMQEHIDSLENSRGVIDNVRMALRGICKLAVSDGAMRFNPATVLYTKQSVKRTIPTGAMSVDEVKLLIEVLPLRERIFACLAIFAGIRPSEITALKWEDISSNHTLVIDDRWYRGEVDTPKNGKSRTTAYPEILTRDLIELRFITPEVGFLFPSPNLNGKPIRPFCMLEAMRKYLPSELQWINFRVMRKTNATLMAVAEVDAKVSADNRGHGLGISMNIYTSSTIDQKRAAVEALAELIGYGVTSKKSSA